MPSLTCGSTALILSIAAAASLSTPAVPFVVCRGSRVAPAVYLAVAQLGEERRQVALEADLVLDRLHLRAQARRPRTSPDRVNLASAVSVGRGLAGQAFARVVGRAVRQRRARRSRVSGDIVRLPSRRQADHAS